MKPALPFRFAPVPASVRALSGTAAAGTLFQDDFDTFSPGTNWEDATAIMNKQAGPPWINAGTPSDPRRGGRQAPDDQHDARVEPARDLHHGLLQPRYRK